MQDNTKHPRAWFLMLGYGKPRWEGGDAGSVGWTTDKEEADKWLEWGKAVGGTPRFLLPDWEV